VKLLTAIRLSHLVRLALSEAETTELEKEVLKELELLLERTTSPEKEVA